MPKPWGILVVHGVGDTRPGATIDDFVTTLAVARSGIEPDGEVQVRWLSEADPESLRHAQPLPVFPSHVRTAELKAGAGGTEPGPDGEVPVEAVVAEVYWSDLSQIREGAFSLIYGLIRLIFSIRFFADQAAVMPAEPKTRGANLARSAARWLRMFLHLTSAVLCGPIAALSVLLTGVLIVDHWMIPDRPSTPDSLSTHEWWSVGWRHDGLMLGIGLVTAGFCLWRWAVGRARGWSSSWTRFLGSLGLLGLLLAGLVAVHQAAPTAFAAGMEKVGWWNSYGETKEVGESNNVEIRPLANSSGRYDLFADLSPTGILAFPLVLLTGVKAAFLLLSVLMLFGFLAVLVAALSHWKWVPGLFAAFGSTLAQIGLWSLLVPALALLTMRALLNEKDGFGPVGSLLQWIQMAFTVYLGTWTLIVVVAIFTYLRRKRWVKKHPEDAGTANRPGKAIPRLIVNASIFGSIVALGLLIRLNTLLAFSPRKYTPWEMGVVSFVNAIAVVAIPVVLRFFGGGLRSGLHVVADVINHFARHRDHLPSPFGDPKPILATDFELQRRIESRARTVLHMLIEDHEPSRLTVVSHSQGTVIAVDLFTGSGASDAVMDRLAEQLGPLTHVDLITMGSPLSHLYQHYFPARYPSLDAPSWSHLKATVRRWVNLYRVDDYVGTDVEESADGWATPGAKPLNVRIAAGGHTAYWQQPRVFTRPELDGLLPGTARAIPLPGHREAVDLVGPVGRTPR